jgi:Tol biopolymer transport system component
VLGYRRLWPYPPPNADAGLVAIAVLAGLGGLWAGSRPTLGARRLAILVMVVASAVLPRIAVDNVPGIAQPPEHPIPGGRTEAISAAPDGNFDLYLLPDGDAARLVALTDTADATELWAQLDPTGSMVAYTLVAGDGSMQLRLLQLGADATVQGDRAVLDDDAGRIAPTTWTPEGDLLVQISPNRGAMRVDRLDVQTGKLARFLPHAGNVAYSPDGRLIAYSGPSTRDPQNWDIWIADADGSHAHDLIGTSAQDEYPAWSPDGSQIVFTSWVEGNADVFRASADGHGVQNLTADSPDRDTSLGWSADGHVLLLSDRSHTGGVFQYFMNADGSDVQLALRI